MCFASSTAADRLRVIRMGPNVRLTSPSLYAVTVVPLLSSSPSAKYTRPDRPPVSCPETINWLRMADLLSLQGAGLGHCCVVPAQADGQGGIRAQGSQGPGAIGSSAAAGRIAGRK